MASSPAEKPGPAEPTVLTAGEMAAQPQPAEGAGGAIDANAADERTGKGAGFEASGFPPLGAAKKKRRKKKNLLERGETALSKSRGTGFEEYYADPPMTPEEYHEEKHGIYDPNRPFHERIEECIQRFRARRRMNSERDNYFTRYLMLGGIDATQRQFTGTRGIDFGADEAGLDANDIRTMSANDIIQRGDTGTSKFYNPDSPEHWDVDFEGVVAGYMSQYVTEVLGAEGKAANAAIDTILNFLNYVLQHDVCPEYEDDVNAARKVCEDAKVELPLCSQALAASPGAFNVAMRHLFCRPAKQFWESDLCYVPDGFDADRICAAAVAIQLPGEYTEAFRDRRRAGRPIQVARSYEACFEVVEVEPAGAEKRRLFAGVKDRRGRTGRVGAVGWMVVRPCVIEDEWDNHPTLADGPPPPPPAGADEAFLVDDDVLAHLRAGMKLRLDVCALDVADLKFVSRFLDVRPSFDTFLPQSLMLLRWREPAPNDRPAPSVDDPERDEREVAQQLMKGEGRGA